MAIYRAFLFAAAWLLCLVFLACDGPGTPLDADSRQRIDSLTAARIRLARDELDSLCTIGRQTALPHLIDSIKQVRLEEIRRLKAGKNPEPTDRSPERPGKPK